MTRHLLVIGGQRCGTTHLGLLLDSHPEITMARPTRPEPKVFLSEEIAERGLDWYHDSYFAHATSEKLLGEKSTSYIEVPEAATRASALLGHAEIVVQLRDPIDRAVSNWRFSSKHGLEDRPLAAALEDNLAGPRDWDPASTSVSPFAYLERGRYVDYLAPWFANFAESVHVTFLDEMVASPSSIRELYAALGVDAAHQPVQLHDLVNQSDGSPPRLGAELYERLREYYRDSDEQLRERLGRELPWLADRTGSPRG